MGRSVRHDAFVTRSLPTGTVTFLFSDVEGSTKLLHDLGTERYASLLLEHRRIMREAFAAEGGVEVGTEGDSFVVAFPTAPGALRAAAAAQQGLRTLPIRVRMGLHTGTPEVIAGDYVGLDIHRAARIAAAGHGGQVLLSASTVALTDGSGLRDLGPHRLKDLSVPEAIWQVGKTDFPRLKSLHQTNLPIAPTPFVGRDEELSAVATLSADDAIRLVTLTGPGGTGKTRLAMQAAAEVAEAYPAGVWWVPLDALHAPELVMPAAAAALGAKGDLAEHIADRRMLIAFDNFEQVVAAATDVAALLAACPRVALLVTSREPLRVRGEREYPVPPLARREAVELFVARAAELGTAVATDDAVFDICARLDDLPLAIELAAARTKVLSVAQIAKRLEQRLPLLTSGGRDVPERQRTLRGAIEWSHELLAPEEQRLFARLAVFRGGWALEAAEVVVDADLDVLQSLVEKSLMRHAEGRFSMLQTIREYAIEHLESSGEADSLRRRHAEYFLAIAEDHEEATLGGDPRDALDALERDHDNLRAAIEWFKAAQDPEPALRLAGSLYEFWCLRGYAHEGFRRLEELLAVDERPTGGRAKALNGSAHLAIKAGAERRVERDRAAESIALNRSLGRAREVAEMQAVVAAELVEEGKVLEGIALLEESIAGFRSTGHENLELATMRSLAWAHDHLGDRGRYREIVEDVLRRARASGMKRMHFTALGALAWAASEDGRFRDALTLLREASEIESESLPRSDRSLLFARLALAHAESGRPESAATLLARAEAIREETGDADPDWVAEFKDRIRTAIGAGLDAAAAAEATARGRAMSADEAITLAFAPLEEPAS